MYDSFSSSEVLTRVKSTNTQLARLLPAIIQAMYGLLKSCLSDIERNVSLHNVSPCTVVQLKFSSATPLKIEYSHVINNALF